ncbi:MAG: phasin family protein [Acidobacteria bacterium]|jgi:poly(hydroxyalkanoate) granule-associated protein|nr:phasin family protein [Thermoanaerobaculia bacterium]NLN11761.1 phasin family protein [Acidobacteriota bacterium]MBP7813395.1 phasin family protein [Thermoanaerobaculia bacterium]HNU83787.1 phasin family protein [Thermoanaerobaculia bacterium]HPA96242.1 phasin family protein [Thermoanaerobaculia bacterium]
MATKQKAKKLPEEVRESASKIWLAGLGALATAEEEGSKLFKNLVKKGEEVESRGKEEIGRFRDLVTEVRGKAGRAIEGVSDRIDDQVAAALARLGVPSKDEIATLSSRVEELSKLVEKIKAPKPARTTAAKR